MTPAGLPRQLEPGSRLDRYELLFQLAEGGTAEIWLARLPSHHGLGTLFAIKVLSSHLADDETARTMLFDEARIAARIRHPNVARIVELGEHDSICYLVLEWVEGESLSGLLRAARAAGRPFPTPVALSVLALASFGLQAAHELADDDGASLRVVHRDVSPQNILVSVSGEVKVIDFGIAKAERRMSERTRQGDIKGKVWYMAPEQVGGGEVDGRVDVWGIGAVLYYLLSGKPPYSGHDELNTLRMLLTRQPPARLEGLEPAVSQILDHTLAVDPDARFATAEELGHALEDAARACGGLVGSRDIARFVEELSGGKLAQRRAALQSGRVPAPESRSGGRGAPDDHKTAPTERLADDPTGASSAQTLPAVYAARPASHGSRSRWIALGLVMATAIGGLVLVVSQRGQPDDEEVSGVEPVAATAALPSVEPTSLAPTAAAPIATPAASAAASAAPVPKPRAARTKTSPRPAPSKAPSSQPGFTDLFQKPK